MRTTVILDPDVERLIRTAMRAPGVSFKEALNTAIRQGLVGAQPRRARRFVQKTYPLGPPQGFR